MRRFLCKSKIHRATVTRTDIDYEGSIAISRELLAAADILPYEKVHVWNVNNGERFSTYVIEGKDGEVSVNGGAARLCVPGDIVIIATFGIYEEREIEGFRQKVVFVDGNNRIK